jgi:DNA-directed RNA polymerase III subunit RPC1
VPKRALSKKLSEKCKRCRVCVYCGCVNGVVKRAGQSLKVVHEKYSKNPDLMEVGLSPGAYTHPLLSST